MPLSQGGQPRSPRRAPCTEAGARELPSRRPPRCSRLLISTQTARQALSTLPPLKPAARFHLQPRPASSGAAFRHAHYPGREQSPGPGKGLHPLRGADGRPRRGARLPRPPAPRMLSPSSGGSAGDASPAASTASWDEPGLLPPPLAAASTESPCFNFAFKEPNKQCFPQRGILRSPVSGSMNHGPACCAGPSSPRCSPAAQVCFIASI